MSQKDAGSHGFGEVLLGRFIRENSLLPSQIAVALAIISRINWEAGCSWPGRSRIAKEANVSINTVDKAISTLKDMKVIEVRRRGKAKTNCYYIGPALAQYYPGANVQKNGQKMSEYPIDGVVSTQPLGTEVIKKKYIEGSPSVALNEESSTLGSYAKDLLGLFSILANEISGASVVYNYPKDIPLMKKLIQQLGLAKTVALIICFCDDRPKVRGECVSYTIGTLWGFKANVLDRQDFKDRAKLYEEEPDRVMENVLIGRAHETS